MIDNMERFDTTADTICAISTAPGMGAIAIIRLSGNDAILIADKLFVSVKRDKRLADAPSHTAHFGTIRNDEGEIIDEVVTTLYIAPHSFTGENSVEIACHGSTFIQQRIIQLLLEKGCRMAQPGEFTQRAFLNGKMDLSQAEAVADVIASNSSAAHRLAIKQMRGGFSKELGALRDKLLQFVSLIELELDFSEEDVEFADRSHLTQLVEEIHTRIGSLADTFQYGNAIKNGIPVAIIGETNVGKSTLLNWLLNEDRAIVSDVHGTTRDIIEDTMQINGTLFRFIDTAGIRKTSDKVEAMGIERTFKKMDEARIVLVVLDTTETIERNSDFMRQNAPHWEGKEAVALLNKVDLSSEAQQADLQQLVASHGLSSIRISAKNNLNKQAVLDELIQRSGIHEAETEGVVVTNLRHYEALRNALSAIDRVREGLQKNLSGDLLSRDIRDCLFFLAEITGGEITNDEVLGNIFRHFCVGK